jgi:hypothetical protein
MTIRLAIVTFISICTYSIFSYSFESSGTNNPFAGYDSNMTLPESPPQQNVFCPEGHAFINVGMTESEVTSACGNPTSKSQSNQQATEKVTVKQLIYTSLASNNPYPGLQDAVFNQWSLPSGPDDSFSLQINIIKGKVSSVQLNGQHNNAMTICGGYNLQVGDDEDQVYSACGTPDATNTTYINQAIPGASKPERWIYQIDQFHPPIRLTFVNGTLKSID